MDELTSQTYLSFLLSLWNVSINITAKDGYKCMYDEAITLRTYLFLEISVNDRHTGNDT